MRHIIYLIAAGILLASCSSTRKHLSKTSDTTESITKTSQTQQSDSSGTKTSQTQLITEKTTHFEKPVTVPADSLAGSLSAKGDTIESGTMRIVASFDSSTGRVHVKATAKPRSVAVTGTTTERQALTTSNQEIAVKRTQTAQESTEAHRTETVTVDRQVEKTGRLTIGATCLGIALLILLIAYLLHRYLPTVGNFFRRDRSR